MLPSLRLGLALICVERLRRVRQKSHRRSLPTTGRLDGLIPIVLADHRFLRWIVCSFDYVG